MTDSDYDDAAIGGLGSGPRYPEIDHCVGTGQRAERGRIADPDRCPVCKRVAYVRLDGTTGSHKR